MITISPIDGRYKNETRELCPFFSEMALMKYRVFIEIEYLIALSLEKGVKELKAFTPKEQKSLRKIYRSFSLKDATRIKSIEKTTRHDIKAVEYFLQEKLKELNLIKAIPFIHFALTSEDVNNLAYTLMWKGALEKICFPQILKIFDLLKIKAKQYATIPLLALTHGQPASPTTIGKELAVYANRLKRQINIIQNQEFQGKLNGSTGTWAAHLVAYPQIDWVNFSEKFITGLGLVHLIYTTQINTYDSLVESYHTIFRINTILIDLSRDMWFYISRGIFIQKKKDGEVGSSTMPHKINPIYFENAEGNLGIANMYFNHFSFTLPISRMQRDLSGSTVIRNQGVPLAHSLLAYKNIQEGLSRILPDIKKIHDELDAHWELLAEPIQIILRKYGYTDAYEKLKTLSRGKKFTKKHIQIFVESLDIPKPIKEQIMRITPHTYLGNAKKIKDLD